MGFSIEDPHSLRERFQGVCLVGAAHLSAEMEQAIDGLMAHCIMHRASLGQPLPYRVH